MRVAAVKALGLLGDPTTAPALAKAVDDETTIIAREAAYALADDEAPQSGELLKALAAKSDHPARVWIAVAMHRVDPTDTDARVKSLHGRPGRRYSSPDRFGAARTGGF